MSDFSGSKRSDVKYPPVERPNGMLQALLLVSHSPPPAFTVLYPLPLIFPFWGHFHSQSLPSSSVISLPLFSLQI